ncbi:MAG: alpha-amylase [Myxococcales bacterium]|nr:alpha-amylase [Myxococcales bacterium]
MGHWFEEAIFYHLYPLGVCGAPAQNDLIAPPTPRLEKLLPWFDQARDLGATALYLGPVFESGSHGYDTVDFFQTDRRLGDNELLAHIVAAAHARGLRVLFDAVFGHVGRDFWAFRDLREHGAASPDRGWFRKIDFGRQSRFGDPFSYEYWNHSPELPRLDLSAAAVREHLFAAVDDWLARYDIDGLRLDSADSLDLNFLAALREHCLRRKPDFFLLGEVIHGDYRRWANTQTLHSVTNYEAYKGLWSSHAQHNFFEIGHSLARQFGEHGLYRDLPLYNFADNHDVNRLASVLREREQLFSLYGLLFTMPGIPSLYYGSEWGIAGTRTATDDRPLRPCLDRAEMNNRYPSDLPDALRRFAAVRRGSPALCRGSYRQLSLAAEQLAFLRQALEETVVVAVNAASTEASINLHLPGIDKARLTDLLNPPERYAVTGGRASLVIPPHWLRVLRVERN